VVYAILSNREVLSSWIHPNYHKTRTGLIDRVLRKLGGGSLLVRKTKCDDWWAYHFSQDEYMFVMVAACPDVHLTVLSEI